MSNVVRRVEFKYGIYLERQEDGGVKLIIADNGETIEEVVVDKYAWSSIIADMSYYGEEDYGYDRACNFHFKQPIDPITTPLKDKPNIFV
jgi:hypothetical protein